jgi:Zn-finger nucleic acid-binding protein
MGQNAVPDGCLEGTLSQNIGRAHADLSLHSALMWRSGSSDGLPARSVMEGPTKLRVAAYNCPNCGAAATPDSPSCRYCGSALAVRICPSCYGAVSIGMRHCPHCGSEVSGSQPEQKGSFQCPRCERDMLSQKVGKHPLQVCIQCGGLWVNKHAFQDICTREEEQEAVLAFQPEPSEPSPPRTTGSHRAYVPCPECKKLMNHKNFSGSGVVLDWCRDHGSWFDRQELQRIIAFIKQGGLRKAREREMSQLKEQESQLRMKEMQISALNGRFDSENAGLELHMGSDPLLKFLSQMFR